VDGPPDTDRVKMGERNAPAVGLKKSLPHQLACPFSPKLPTKTRSSVTVSADMLPVSIMSKVVFSGTNIRYYTPPLGNPPISSASQTVCSESIRPVSLTRSIAALFPHCALPERPLASRAPAPHRLEGP
jgi:hypothetical protein